MEVANQLHAFVWRSMTHNNCNTYLINGSARVLIDPGHLRHFDHVRTSLAELGLTIQDIDLVICTHAHLDHLESAQLFSRLPAAVAIHAAEWQMAAAMRRSPVGRQQEEAATFEPDFLIREGNLRIQDLDLEIIDCPGHSPGSVSVYWPARNALFAGDLIFKDGIGRTDLPQASGQQLKDSIKKVSQLDIALLLPGHGDILALPDGSLLAVHKDSRNSSLVLLNPDGSLR